MNGEAESITTYLEMREPQNLQVTPPHRAGMLLRIGEAVVPFYRYLTGELGSPVDGLGDEAVSDRLVDDDYDIYVIYLGGVPAAMFELDRRTPSEVELVGFGVMRGFKGRGLSRYLLASAIDTAWQHGPDRMWVKATNRDDPHRILLLQWAGFVPYQTTRERPGHG